MTKYCPHLNDDHNYVKQGQPASQPLVLKNPFPAPQQMVAEAPAPPSGGALSSSATISMVDTLIGISM